MGRPFGRWPLDRLGGDDRTAFDNRAFAGRLVVHRLRSWSANIGLVKRQPAVPADDRDPMTAFGTKQTSRQAQPMFAFGSSALSPNDAKADVICLSDPVDARSVAPRRSEMDVQVLCFHIRKLALNRRFDVSAFDNLPVRHHP